MNVPLSLLTGRGKRSKRQGSRSRFLFGTADDPPLLHTSPSHVHLQNSYGDPELDGQENDDVDKGPSTLWELPTSVYKDWDISVRDRGETLSCHAVSSKAIFTSVDMERLVARLTVFLVHNREVAPL